MAAPPIPSSALTTPASPAPISVPPPTTPQVIKARPGAGPPPIPSGPLRLNKREKKERARQRLAERGLLAPEATFADRSGRPADAAPPLPFLEGGGQPIGENALPEILERLGQTGAGVPDESPAPSKFQVPSAIRLLALVDLVMGVASLLVAGAMAQGGPAALSTNVGGSGFGIPTLCLFGLTCLVAGGGLILLQPFGRKVQLALCVASLPMGGLTLPAAALIAIYLLRPGAVLLLSGRAPGDLTPEERGRIRDDALGLILIRVAAAIQMLVLVYHLWPIL